MEEKEKKLEKAKTKATGLEWQSGMGRGKGGSAESGRSCCTGTCSVQRFGSGVPTRSADAVDSGYLGSDGMFHVTLEVMMIIIRSERMSEYPSEALKTATYGCCCRER